VNSSRAQNIFWADDLHNNIESEKSGIAMDHKLPFTGLLVST